MFDHIKFKNTKENRKLLLENGYEIHDPQHTFCRKNWMIFSDEEPRYILGVEHRHKRREVTFTEFLQLKKENFLTRLVNYPKILELSEKDKSTINSILEKY